MNNFKNNSMKTKIIAVIACAILSVSCSDFLDQDVETKYTAEQVFSKMDNVEPFVKGALTSWRNLQKDRSGMRFTLGTDEGQQGAFQVRTDADQAELDYYNNYRGAENSTINAMWNERYLIVNSAAQVINYLPSNIEPDAERRAKLIGRASFLRAAVMFELARYWGPVPVIDIARVNELGFGRQPLDVVYGQIVADLQDAIQKLPESESDRSLPTKWVAQALLGKVYMSAQEESGFRDYTLAKNAFEAVINSGRFSLLPSYANLFSQDFSNTQESVYEFQFNNTYPDNNQLQFQLGSRAVSAVDQRAFFMGYDLLLPTQHCYQDVNNGGIWETGDTRKNASIRYDFTYRGSVPPLPAGFGGDELDPHVKKFEDPRTQGATDAWYSGKNKHYIRYSDVLLSYAECLNELGQTGQAEGFVNQVRTRAFGGTLPAGMAWSGTSQSDFKVKILDERMRELAFEGWRRIDLLRTGKFVELVRARNKWANQSGTISATHLRYPIPLLEIKKNDEIGPGDQNPGY